MSRFIDVDKFEEKNAKVWEQFGKEDFYYSVGYILSQASVDAIPVEWIRSWAARTIKFTDIHKKSVFIDTISLLLLDWDVVKRGANSANDEWVEMMETMMQAERKREEEKDERSKD